MAALLLLSPSAAPPAAAAGGGELLLEAALRALARRAGLALDLGKVRVNLRGEVTVEGLSIELKGGRVEIPKASGKVDLGGLLKRRLSVERLRLEGPRVLLRAGAGLGARTTPGEGQWSVAIPALEASGLIIEREGAAGAPGRRWEIGLLKARVREDRVGRSSLEILSAALSLEGSTVSVKGQVSFSPLRGEAELDFRGPLSGEARIAGKNEDWTVRGQGHWKGASWAAAAELGAGETWKGELSWANLAGGKVGSWAAPLGTSEGKVQGNGRGFSREPEEAAGKWDVQTSTGLSFFGSGDWIQGKLRWETEASGGGISAKAAGHYAKAGDELEASWTLAADTGAFRGWTGFGHGGVEGEGRIYGKAENPRGEISLEVQGLGLIETAPIERFSLAVEGLARGHNVSWAAEYGVSTAAAGGRGSWEGGVWQVDWEELSSEGAFAAKAGPFRTRVSRDLLAVRGLVLEGSEGLRLRLDGDRRAGRWQSLLVEATGADLSALGRAVGRPIPLTGALNLRGQAVEGPDGLAGDFLLESEGASLYGLGPGPLSATGVLAAGTARLEKLEWLVGGSSLAASGWARVGPGGSSLGRSSQEGGDDFNLRVVAPKPGISGELPSGPLRAQGLGFSCDMTLSRSSGQFSGSGLAELAAKTMAVPAAGWLAADVQITLAGRGDRVEVVAAKATTGDRPLKVTGGLGLKGPELRVQADNLTLIPQPGLNAEARVDVTLEGSWAVPSLWGTVFLTRLDYEPPRAKRKWWQFYKDIIPEVSDTVPGASISVETTPLPPLTADLKIKFDKNVWYKRAQASVELKGDLWIKKEPRAPPTIFGTVETVRGNASYLGRHFRIESGRIEFGGEYPADPTIEAGALWIDERSQTRVKLDLKGNLGRPRLALSSVPPLEQRDIVSLLVTGRPFEKAEGGAAADGEAARRAAEQLLAAYASQKVRQSVLKPLQLDVFQLRMRGGGSAGVTLGRYVTKELFVVYDQAVGGGRTNRLRAEYSISPNWSLEGLRTSEGHGVGDLFYKVGWK